MSDFPTLVGYLKRTASSAGFDMTVNTALVRKMVAAVELAEAQVEIEKVVERITGPVIRDADWQHATLVFADKVNAYRQATGR